MLCCDRQAALWRHSTDWNQRGSFQLSILSKMFILIKLKLYFQIFVCFEDDLFSSAQNVNLTVYELLRCLELMGNKRLGD